MKLERADEIVRKVFYANLHIMPQLKDGEEAFRVGRMVGIMQRQLEIELAEEVKIELADELEKGE